MKPRLTPSLAFGGMLLLAGNGLCEPPVFKSVDADGNVSYSSTPPADAVKSEPIAILPPPEADARDEAQKQANQLEASSKRLQDDLQTSRNKRNSTLNNAQEMVEKAQRDLDKAKQISDGDWQPLAKGGRRLKESYHERVKAAEDRLQQAQKTQAATRRDLR